MTERLFEVKVYYMNDVDMFDHSDVVTIVAKDDVKARNRAIELILQKDKNEKRNEIKKILFCAVEYVGTLDGHAKA